LENTTGLKYNVDFGAKLQNQLENCDTIFGQQKLNRVFEVLERWQEERRGLRRREE
jgi:hypothetical protein